MNFVIPIFKRFIGHRLMELAAQCSYYFILSLFPFLIFMITLLGFIPFTVDADISLVEEFLPADIYVFIENQWTSITSQQSTGLLSVSILFTLWSASAAMNTVIRLLNRSYQVTEDRSFIKGRLISIFLTIGLFGVILVALNLQVIGGVLRNIIPFDFIFFDFDVLRWVLSSIVLFTVFAFIYYVGPNIRLIIREIYIGAIFATIGWQLTSFLFSFYLNNFANYTATYGAIGTVIALMVWFYISSIIILLGGEINAELKDSNKFKNNDV